MWADLALINGNVLTLNPSNPHAEAVAIQRDKIVKVGTNKEINPWIQKHTKVMDLKAKTVAPGFIDTHVHLTEFGISLNRINLRGVKSIQEIQEKIKKWVRGVQKGKWIQGYGWDQEHLKDKRYPTRWDLDDFSRENPVVLNRVCCHACVLNSKALDLSDITADTTSPSGGLIDKDPKTGEPTGILRDNAMELVHKNLPLPDEKDLMEAAALAFQKALESGVTSLHWMISSRQEVRIIQKLRAQNRLPIRVYLVFPVELLGPLNDLGVHTSFGDNVIRLGSIKIVADGSLGAHTAALCEPYSDDSATKGIMMYTQEELNDLVAKANKAHLQLAVHAIGDRTMDCALTAFEKALEDFPRKDHRHRIEHASVLNDALIQRMKRLKVIASIQPHFVHTDFWVVDRVGSTRAKWVYPFKTLINSGILVTGGSDCPVEPINPLLGVHAAVTRDKFPSERISVEDALRLYTVKAAYASFEENVKGSIETGKLADLVVLSDDPLITPSGEIKDIRVEKTIIGGRVVYASQPVAF